MRMLANCVLYIGPQHRQNSLDAKLRIAGELWKQLTDLRLIEFRHIVEDAVVIIVMEHFRSQSKSNKKIGQRSVRAQRTTHERDYSTHEDTETPDVLNEQLTIMLYPNAMFVPIQSP